MDFGLQPSFCRRWQFRPSISDVRPSTSDDSVILSKQSRIRENSCNPCLIPAGAGGNDGPAATIFDTDFTDFH
jgi:hypothetical protein